MRLRCNSKYIQFWYKVDLFLCQFSRALKYLIHQLVFKHTWVLGWNFEQFQFLVTGLKKVRVTEVSKREEELSLHSNFKSFHWSHTKIGLLWHSTSEVSGNLTKNQSCFGDNITLIIDLSRQFKYGKNCQNSKPFRQGRCKGFDLSKQHSWFERCSSQEKTFIVISKLEIRSARLVSSMTDHWNNLWHFFVWKKCGWKHAN